MNQRQEHPGQSARRKDRRMHSEDAPAPSGLSIELKLSRQQGPVLLRPIRPQDAELYRAFAERITVDDRRRRFHFAGPTQLTPALLAQFTEIDRKREMAFVAIDRETSALFGVARMYKDKSGDGAEFALIVRSDLQRRGLGRALMQQLIGYARSTNIGRLHGSVLAANSAMLRMCKTLGFTNSNAGDGTLRAVSLSLK
jgi:RimJ/RimL family protein N-acetyltransferase